MKRRRILFLNTVGFIGGQEMVLLDLVRGLDPARFDSVLATLMPGALDDAVRAEGKATYDLPPHRIRQPLKLGGALLALANILERERIDVVHCNGDSLLFYGVLASLRGRQPCVWHVYEPVVRRGNPYERFFYETQRLMRPAFTIFGTAAVEESYEREYPRLGPRLPIMPAVDVDAILAGSDGGRARERLGVGSDTPIFSVIGRLQRSKGQREAIQALTAVETSGPAPHLVLCGGPPIQTDEDYPAELRALAAELGVAARVHFVGALSEAQKRDLLQATTALVHPAHREAFGIVVIEGMGAGKPVIVTDAVGPKSIVDGSGGAELVPRRDVPALARAMERVLADPERARRMGQLGQAHARARYDKRAMVRRVEQVYDEVLDARTRR